MPLARLNLVRFSLQITPMFRKLIDLGIVGLLVLIFVSLFGRYFPPGDSIAVFRIPLVLILISIIWMAPKFVKFLGLVVILITLFVDGLHRYGNGYDPNIKASYRLYQKNVSYRVKDTGPLVADIIHSNANFVTLQEVSFSQEAFLQQLSTIYPHQHHCPFYKELGGPTILSRLPFIENSLICLRGLAAAKVQASDGELWIISLHLYWPWPHDQSKQIDQLEPFLSSLDAPVILAGDFNAVPWSGTLQRVKQILGTKRVGPVKSTFADLPLIPMGLTIDHILASSRNHRLELRPNLGSDHKGLLADIDPAGAS